jgi:peptidoglycan LD-endopeptidase CwlK
MNLTPIILACQHKLNVTADGKDGPETWQAIYKALHGQAWHDPMNTTMVPVGEGMLPIGDAVDERSEKNIATLLPHVRPYARALVHAAAQQGIKIKVISGSRTYAEQDALFRQCCDGKDNDGDGRVDEPDERVTKARGGQSNHNFGIAFDIGVWQGDKYVPDSPLYKVVGALGRRIGLLWGGDWVNFNDEPHYEYNPKGYTVSQMRERTAAGLPLS